MDFSRPASGALIRSNGGCLAGGRAKKKEERTEEVERKTGILFNLCQSRREEDNSLTGSKLECDGEEKPWVCRCVRVGVCWSRCVCKTRSVVE